MLNKRHADWKARVVVKCVDRVCRDMRQCGGNGPERGVFVLRVCGGVFGEGGQANTGSVCLDLASN